MDLRNPRDRTGRGNGDFGFGGDSGRYALPKKGGQGRRRRRLVGPVLAICAVLAVLVTADYWANSGKIFRGVEVGSVDVGGSTPEEARALVEERASSEDLDEIRLTGGPEEVTLGAREVGLSYDVDATVDAAYGIGREGGVLQRLSDRIGAAWGTVPVPPVFDYDRGAAREEIENLARRVNRESQDAYVNVTGAEAEVVESREGYLVDAEGTVANLEGSLEEMSGEVAISGEAQEPAVLTAAAEEAAGTAREAMAEPVTLSASGRDWQISPREIGRSLSFAPEGGAVRVGLDREGLRSAMDDVYEDLTVEPVEAGFEVSGDRVSVTDSQTGRTVDEERLTGDLESGLFRGERTYEVPLITDEPELTTERAESLKPTQLIGSYRTNYMLSTDQSTERIGNLNIASDAISGTLLAPGEVFSANEILSPLDYYESKVIIDGREEKADGGGLCQVSSTLYMAANYAGLDVLERQPHMSQLPYIRPGMDATVWFGAIDMKFENTTDGYILIQEWVDSEGYVNASIYGRPSGREVEMTSEPVYMENDYSEWVTYQKVTDEDGEVVYDGILHEDTYKPLVDEKGRTIPPPEVPVPEVNY